MKAFFAFAVLMALVVAVFCRPQESLDSPAVSGGPNAMDGIKKIFEGFGAALKVPLKAISGDGDPSELLHAISALSEGIEEIAAAGRGARNN